MEKEVVVDGKVINLEVSFPSARSGTPQANKSSGAWEEPFIGVALKSFPARLRE